MRQPATLCVERIRRVLTPPGTTTPAAPVSLGPQPGRPALLHPCLALPAPPMAPSLETPFLIRQTQQDSSELPGLWHPCLSRCGSVLPSDPGLTHFGHHHPACGRHTGSLRKCERNGWVSGNGWVWGVTWGSQWVRELVKVVLGSRKEERTRPKGVKNYKFITSASRRAGTKMASAG